MAQLSSRFFICSGDASGNEQTFFAAFRLIDQIFQPLPPLCTIQ